MFNPVVFGNGAKTSLSVITASVFPDRVKSTSEGF